MDPVDFLMIAVLAGLALYLFFLPKQPGLPDMLGIGERGVDLRLRVRESSALTEAQRQTRLFAVGGALAGFVLGFIITGQLVVGILFLAVGALVPMITRTRRADPRKEMKKAMPRLLLNLSTVLKESENLYIAFRLSVQEEEGPVFEHILARLDDVNVRVSLSEILNSLAEYYKYEPFTSLVRVLEQAERTGVPSDKAVADIEKHLFIDRETEAKMSIARRSLVIMAIGVLGLLPAMMCVVMGPMAVDLIPKQNLPVWLQPPTPTPAGLGSAPEAAPSARLAWIEPGGTR